MSVEVSHKGRVVRILIPKEIADGCTVEIIDCPKTETDEECNWCSGKYSCKLFVESMPKLIPTIIN